MKKLLLTSAGFENPKIAEYFLSLIKKQPQDIKILFIPTASRTLEEISYVNGSRQELLSLGLKKENIIEYISGAALYQEVLDTLDSIYVCGGNTFYLMSVLKKTGFNKKIIELVDKGAVYVGVSAGSIIAGPDIEIAGIGPDSDTNDIHLKDLSALNLCNSIIYPHYDPKNKIIEKHIKLYEQKTKKKVIRLTNNQALLINKTKKVIE